MHAADNAQLIGCQQELLRTDLLTCIGHCSCFRALAALTQSQGTQSMGTQQEGIFLPGLARAFQSVDTSGDLSTLQFAKACDAILPVFDRLGEL